MKTLRGVIGWFRPYWSAHKRPFLCVLGLTVLGVGARVTYPLIFKFVIDALEKPELDTGSTTRWIWILLGVGLFQQVLQWLLPATRAWVNYLLSQAIRMRMFRSILGKRSDFFVRYRSGDLITRLTDDIDAFDKLQWYSCSGIMRPIEAILILVFSLAVIATLSWELTLWSCLPLPIVVWILSRTEGIQRRHYRERQKLTSETTDVLESAFKGVRIILSFVAERAQARILNDVLKQRERAEKNVLTIRAILETLGALLNQIGVVIVLFVGGFYHLDGRISLGDFYAFVVYLSSMTQPIWTISWFFVSTTMVDAGIERMVEIEEEPSRALGDQLPVSSERLVADRVGFGFRDGHDLLNELDLEVGRSELVAVVGAVGCGKTTLLELCGGILQTRRGRVAVDETPVITVDEERRSHIVGYVPQENLLFSGTVSENIALDRNGIDTERISHSLRIACVDGEFPPEREIAQGGVGLSGGQRARVSLARAIAGNPAFLILDDVTSALDAETEARFWSGIRQHLPETGILVSTHREATARLADRVAWLEGGKVREVGSHRELLARSTEYQALFAQEASAIGD